MARPRRRLRFAGAVLGPLLATLSQVPLTAHADPTLSPPMHMTSWREVLTTNPSAPYVVLHVFGEVSNTGTDARSVRVTCKLFGDPQETQVLATETVGTALDTLKQNELSPFDAVFMNPPAATAIDHFGCQLSGGAGTTDVANHDFSTIITSNAGSQSQVTGTIENTRDVPVKDARIFFTFYSGGNVADVDSLLANGDGSLAPGLPATAFTLVRTNDRPSWDTVTAIAEAPSPWVQLPSPLDFADQIQGTTSAVNNLVLTNVGTGDLHVATDGVAISGANAGDFAVAHDGCSAHTVMPDSTCTIGLTFTPSTIGAETATVSVSDDATANPQSSTLNGNGLSRAAATISPQTLAFGDQVTNTSTMKTITVTSIGPDPVTLNPVNVGGTNPGDFVITSDSCSGQTVAVNSTCGITVTFTPGALGARSATLTITDNGRIPHDPVDLTGNGVAVQPGPQATFGSDHLTFAPQVNDTTTTQDITLTNTGGSDLLISSIDVANTSTPFGNDFRWATDTCPRSPQALASLASCTITVSFTPSALGSRSGSLTVTSNVISTPAVVALTGTGLATRGPTVSSWGRGRLDVFMKGANGELWHKFYDSSIGWSGWSSLGAPPVAMASDPIAISWGRARIDVFVRGADNHLWHIYYDVALGGWSIWYNHGGTLTSAPTATTWGWGRLDVFYRGSDNTLRHIFYAAFIGVWSTEYNHGGTLASDPSAISWGYARIDVVARGSDGSLQHNDYDITTGGWAGWQSVPGMTLISRPTITTWGPGRLDVFAQGSDNTLQHTYFYAGTWQGWTSQGSPSANALTSDPFAIAWSYGRIDIFARGQNGTLLHKYYDSSVGWSGWYSDSLLANPG